MYVRMYTYILIHTYTSLVAHIGLLYQSCGVRDEYIETRSVYLCMYAYIFTYQSRSVADEYIVEKLCMYVCMYVYIYTYTYIYQSRGVTEEYIVEKTVYICMYVHMCLVLTRA